jgi:hypothetical protein
LTAPSTALALASSPSANESPDPGSERPCRLTVRNLGTSPALFVAIEVDSASDPPPIPCHRQRLHPAGRRIENRRCHPHRPPTHLRRQPPVARPGLEFTPNFRREPRP